MATLFLPLHFHCILICVIIGGLEREENSTEVRLQKIQAKLDIGIFWHLMVRPFWPNIGASQIFYEALTKFF